MRPSRYDDEQGFEIPIEIGALILVVLMVIAFFVGWWIGELL